VKRRLIALLFLISLMLTPSVNAQFLSPKEASIRAVAVTSGNNPQGVVINISVVVTEGDGKVYISTSPYTEIDMQGSAEVAAMTACDLIGEDFNKYDFFFTIKADAPIVGGPSAGGVMTIAVISALKDLEIRSDVFMTGMIYPDGFIGPVGGIPYKLQAAKEHGAEIFLIPRGQKVVYVQETKEEREGPFIFIHQEAKPVNLVELGQKLGVEVLEVETVEDALRYYTGYSIEKVTPSLNLTDYSKLISQLPERMKKSVLILLEDVRTYATHEELSDVQRIIDEANETFLRGDYYTATSQYFTAAIRLRTIQYTRTLKNEEALNGEFTELMDELNETIDEVKGYDTGVESFQILGAAEERVAIAGKLIDDARRSGDYTTAAKDLALAKERIESAKLWISLMPSIKEDAYLNEEEIRRRAESYLTQAESIIIYARSINGEGNFINEAERSADLAGDQLSRGMYAGAAISAIDAITKAEISIDLINADENMLNSEINVSESGAKEALSETGRYITPILPAAYFEFGKTSDAPVEKLYYYKLSARIAKLLFSLAKKEGAGFVEVELTPETTNRTPGFGIAIPAALLVFLSLIRRRRGGR